MVIGNGAGAGNSAGPIPTFSLIRGTIVYMIAAAIQASLYVPFD